MNKEHIEIMKHTRENRLFCGDSKEMRDLVEKGLMESAGKKSFVPDEYFRLTPQGKSYLDTLYQHETKIWMGNITAVKES